MYKNAGTLAILVWALLLYTIRVRSLDFFPQSLFLVHCTWHTSSSHATRIAFFRTYQQKWPCTILCRIKIYIRFIFVHNWLMDQLRLFQITISRNQPGYQTGICYSPMEAPLSSLRPQIATIPLFLQLTTRVVSFPSFQHAVLFSLVSGFPHTSLSWSIWYTLAKGY